MDLADWRRPVSVRSPATFERLMDHVLCGMGWSRCLVCLDDVIPFGTSIPEALARLEEVLSRLSDFGLQLKAKKCTSMQMEVTFLGHIVGRTGLACDPEKISVVRNWHAPDKVKAVHQFVGFVGYCLRFVKDFAGLAEPLVALTRKGASFVWTYHQQAAFEALKACLISAPILGFPTEDGRFFFDTDASLFAVGYVLNQVQGDRELVIAYVSRSLRLSQHGIVRRAERCWRRLLRAHIFGRTFGVLSSPYAQITVLSGGCRSFAMVMGCWPAGTCCWTNSQLYLSTVRGHNMPMWTVCLDIVDNVRDLTVRYRRLIYGFLMWTPR